MNNILNQPVEENNNVKNYIADSNTYVDNFSSNGKILKILKLILIIKLK